MMAHGKGTGPEHEWERTAPDIVVFLPQGGGKDDEDNEVFLVLPSPGNDELIAFWTQSSCEGRGDNHLVLSRSRDGRNWSPPSHLTGSRPGSKGRQASWGFPVVSPGGRIYCFFTKETKDVEESARQAAGFMGCLFSDDGGHSWKEGADIVVPKNRFDNPDPKVPKSWWTFQNPIRDRKGRVLIGYSQATSASVYRQPHPAWVHQDSRCAFLRFENIEANPDPGDLKISWLPRGGEGIAVPDPMYPQISVAQEPGLALLPDGRLFTVLRTMTGSIWYSVSSDDGDSWRAPEPLCYRDDGAQINHPMSPCPIYGMADGRYLLLFHNNPGTKGRYSQFTAAWDCNHANFIRNPAYLAVGEFRRDAHQPIWFSRPRKFLDTGDVPVGPKNTAEAGTYPSLTEWKGERILWYPDRKYYLLGKRIPDGLLADLRVE